MKKTIILSAIGFILGIVAAPYLNPIKVNETIKQSLINPQLEQNKQLVKDSFKIFEKDFNEKDLTKHHALEYVQYSNNKKTSYNEFVDHIKRLKEDTKSIEIVFDQLIAEGNKVATVYQENIIKKDGYPVKVKVIALFEIREGKIVRTDESSEMVEGTKEDADLVSLH